MSLEHVSLFMGLIRPTDERGDRHYWSVIPYPSVSGTLPFHSPGVTLFPDDRGLELPEPNLPGRTLNKNYDLEISCSSLTDIDVEKVLCRENIPVY